MPALSLKKLILYSVLATLTGIVILLILLLPEEIGIAQIILVALLLLAWPVAFFASHFLRNRKKAAPADESAQPVSAGSLSPTREYQELSRGADEVVQFLRNSRSGNREVSDAIYGVPWYVLGGPPGSGKTSMALSTGASFHALSSQRRADQNLVRPTRDCEWRVTDNGVLIDTAGRYFTEGPDRDEWLGLVDTLKKYRRNRPLDGFVMTVNATTIIGANESEIEQQAQILRGRLDEMIKSTGVRFPVYLVFSHLDSIAGFKEFFATLPANERSQVWGATIPLEQAGSAHALFDVEFDYLVDSLSRRRLLRLSTATSPVEQHGVFNFPLKFSETRRKLGLFTLALFRPNPFSAPPLLRGFYFTSNSTGIDGRITTPGTFVSDLFEQVIFRDRDIASSFQSTRSAPNKLARIRLATGAIAAVCAIWFGGSILSYFNNSSMVAEAQENSKRVLDHYEAGRGQKVVKTNDAELADLDKLRDSLRRIDEYDNGFLGSLTHRFGLYSGGKIRTRARQIYFDFVSQRFLAPAINQLEGELASSSPSKEDELDQYYYKLQALKMLESQERVDSRFLEERLGPYWSEAPSERGKKENLAFYADQAASHDDDDKTVPRPIADTARVNEARTRLKNYSATKRVYNDIIRRINKLGEAIDLARVLEGQEGSELLEETNPSPVPYAFTKRAYFKHVTGDAIARVKEEMGGKDDWVMGEKSAAQSVNIDELRARYSSDYAAAWEKFLKAISIRKFANKNAAVDALGTLSQENSPLKRVITYVANEANLSVPPKDSGTLAWLKGFLASKVGVTDPKITTAFGPLIKFAAGEAPSRYLAKLGEVRDKLRSAPGTNWNEVAAALRDNKEFEKSVGDTRDLLKPLDPSPGSKAAAEFLARPLDIIGAGQKGGDARNLDDAWRNLVASARKLEARFPFSPSTVDVQIPDLVAFYNPVDGEFANAYKKFLSNLVEGTPGQLKSRNTSEFSDAAVVYLNQVFKLQSALFPAASQQPKVSYSLAVATTPARKVEVSADGSKVTADGSSTTATLSWPSSGETGVRVIVSDKNATAGSGAGAGKEVANFQGLWGVFRMVGSNRYQFEWGGTVQPPSNNPFAIEYGKIRAPETYK